MISQTARRLTVELVPSTCWYSNVRSEVSPADWDQIKKRVFGAAGHRCEICGGRGSNWPVECHEIWHYDEKTRIQTLKGFIALCPDCHQVKHIGLAQINGVQDEAIKHLMAVNQWRQAEAERHLFNAYKLWMERSQHKWTLDISLLDEFAGVRCG